MKKFFTWTLAWILLISTSFFASAESGASWYFSSKNQNDRPSLPFAGTEAAKGIGKDEKVLYLTFDAGYENGNVKKTVDILKEAGVTGTFFVLSHFIEANPDLCREIKENGNLVCNHTSNHPSVVGLSRDKLQKELEEVADLYRKTTGYEMDPYFRPPKGEYTTKALEMVAQMGYRTVFWSLAWADWDNNNQKSPEYAMEKLTKRVHNGAVILLHPTSETNVKILPEFLAEMKRQGYRFATVEELWEA